MLVYAFEKVKATIENGNAILHLGVFHSCQIGRDYTTFFYILDVGQRIINDIFCIYQCECVFCLRLTVKSTCLISEVVLKSFLLETWVSLFSYGSQVIDNHSHDGYADNTIYACMKRSHLYQQIVIEFRVLTARSDSQ